MHIKYFEKKRNIIILFTSIFFIMSFWVFSRFTVDDAFISWRYGKNLVDYGVWNYNPSNIDLTQAYTSPIYAILSIIPNYFNIDVVLFFKVFSIIIIIVFFILFNKKTKMPILTFIFLSLPATIIHAFSGLETFLFISLITFMIISLHEKKFKTSTILCSVLFFVRPEAWVFLFLVPSYYILSAIEENIKSGTSLISSVNLTLKNKKTISLFLISFAIFSTLLAAYFYLHKMHFDYLLPNTYYAKSGVFFNPFVLLLCLFFMLPLLMILLRKNLSLLLLCLGFFSALLFIYSTSDLQMNYAQRFVFHIAAPAYLISIYIASTFRGEYLYFKYEAIKGFKKIPLTYFLSIFPVLFLIVFFAISLRDSVRLTIYYPKSIDSHAALGKTINMMRNEIKSFSFGDAGMASYHSGINALDNIGLGSSLVAKNGLTKSVFIKYNPDIIVFHSEPTLGIKINNFNQDKLLFFANKYQYKELCDIYAAQDYTLKIYTKKQHEGNLNLTKLCEKSKLLNNTNNIEYFLNNIYKSPFQYWKE